MKYPTIKLLFDRKHVASKTTRGLLQIQIAYKCKRRFVSTGVKLYINQWNESRHVINHIDSIELNEEINGRVATMERWVRENMPFSWEKLDKYLNKEEQPIDFIEFIETTLKGRNDIRESTRKAQYRIVSILKKWGGINTFADLTTDKILDFDNYLHGRRLKKYNAEGHVMKTRMRQDSIYNYHKLLKTYIGIAVKRGIIKGNPYLALHFKKGNSEPDRYLTVAELKVLEEAQMRSGSIARARDLFVFECYTGLSYSDLMEFDFSKAERTEQDTLLYRGRRVKTGVPYYFVLLPKAMEILRKYNYKLPVVSDVVLNRNLKVAAKCAGINKPLASHWARRTAGMMFANSGVRMEVVAKILGHSTTKITQKFYASISAQTVAAEMSLAQKE